MRFDPTISIPAEIIEAERKVSLWFAENNIEEWWLGGSCCREHDEAGVYRAALVKIASMNSPWDGLGAAKAIALATMNDYDHKHSK